LLRNLVSAAVRCSQLFTRTCNSRNVSRFVPIKLSQNIELYDVNSGPQTVNKALDSIRDLRFELLEYSYSLGIVHSDLHMFGNIKNAVIGFHFYINEEVKNRCNKIVERVKQKYIFFLAESRSLFTLVQLI